MTEDKRLLILGKKSGGGGDAVWGSIGGTITDQTDLMTELNNKADTSSIPTKTSDLTNDSGYITLNDVPAQVQSNWSESDTTSPAYIDNKPTIPTVNDSTITIQQNGTTVGTFTTNDANDTTINLTGGGGGNSWYGTQAEFDSLTEYDDNTDYFISDKIDYITDIKHKPNLNAYAKKNEVDSKNAEQDLVIAGKMSGRFMTQEEFEALGDNVPEGENYFIEGNTIEMVVTFTDQTTATYNVVVD